jgi:hypothetical protein
VENQVRSSPGKQVKCKCKTPKNNRIQYEDITSPKVIEDYGFV